MKPSTRIKMICAASAALCSLAFAELPEEPWISPYAKVIKASPVTHNAAQPTELWAVTNTKAANVSAATHLAAMQSGEVMHVALSLNLRNEANLDAFVQQISTNKAIAPMTSDQILANHAPTAADANAVATYLAQHGFKNITVAKNRMLVSADGTAAAVKESFQTEIHLYKIDGRVAHANISDAVVPKSLSGIVQSIHGLQDIHVAHSTAKVVPFGLSSATLGPIYPINFPAIYNAGSLPTASNTSIGIIAVGSLTQTLIDLHSFIYLNSFPTPSVTVINAGAAGTDTTGIDEWNMDSQAIIAAAGGTVKELRFYTATTWDNGALTEAFNSAVTENIAKVINVSLGECELDTQSSGMNVADDAIFKIGIAQGQTFSVSAGDNGAYTCGGNLPSLSYPAASPYVISLGGTTVYGTGPTLPNGLVGINTWAGENVWSCGNSYLCAASGGTGGGISITEPAPGWQLAAGVLGTSKKRGVPDIAFDANPSSGAAVVVKGAYQQIGGTSLASPIFVGFWSRIETARNNSVAFPAAAIYQNAATHPAWFNDITFGSNGYYHAKAGWDYTTGYGSLNVANFATGF